MVTSKNSTARRREVRRNLPRPSPRWSQWFSNQKTLWALTYALVFIVISSLIVISNEDQTGVQIGQTMPQTATARVQFRAIDQDKTLAKQEDASNREPAVYIPNQDYLHEVNERLLVLAELGAKENIEQIPEQERKALELTPKAWSALRQFHSDPAPTPTWAELTEQFIGGFAGLAVLDSKRAQIERDETQRATKIVIRHPSLGQLVRSDSVLIDVENDQKALHKSIMTLANTFPRDLRRTVVTVATQNPRPIYQFDEEVTRRRRQFQFDNQDPVEMTYQPGDVLVSAGKVIQQLDLLILQQERLAYRAQIGMLGIWLSRGGSAGLMVLIGLGLWVYIAAYNPKITGNTMRGLAITVLLLLCQGWAVLGTGLGPKFLFVTATFPTLFAAIILAIAYDQRFALAIAVIHCLIVLVSMNQTVSFGLVLLVGVAVAVSQLHDVRTRSTLVKVGVWSGLAMGTATLLVGFAHRPLHLDGEITRIFFDAYLALASGFGTGLVVQGILPTIERLFSVTTSMTLRELNDASHPLLRRLAQEAPGTYQHSLRLADMAEAAADTIGANGLLCKVGAMYHDIGKMNKPAYFVENQGGGPNRHNKLSPAMSLLIIVGHVKDGMEMAREFNLPRPLRHFIESHHGTTLVEYFYHAAKQKREAEDKPAPTEFEFRYPGPKPQNKEAAILMLCDNVESAARTLDDPTASRIEQLVHAIANKRLMGGQFDECNITLQDLHKIETSLVKTLCAIYHSRIKYPGDKHDQPAAETAPSHPQHQNTATSAAS